MNKNERNFWLDLMMLIAFSITIVSGIVLWLTIPGRNITHFDVVGRTTWLAFHVGSGLTGLLGVIIHIVWHKEWLKALRGRPLESLKGPVKTNRLINRMTWIAFIISNIFGLLAWLLPASMTNEVIKMINRFHVATSMTWIVLMASHLVLHRKWIVSALQRYLSFGFSANAKSNLGSGS
jgi:hypothetical protein